MKIAFKNFLMTLKRYKMASVLNIAGLTLSFAAFYVIASQVIYSLTYNHSLKDSERTYLISPDFGSEDGKVSWTTNSPVAIAYEAKEQFPYAEEMASISQFPIVSRFWVQYNEHHKEFINENVRQATSNIPEFFGFECVSGDFSKFKEPNTVIVARSMSETLNLRVGDIVWFEGGEWHDNGIPSVQNTIVAIYEDLPDNTFFRHWKIIQNNEKEIYAESNNNWNYCNLVRFSKDADIDAFLNIFKQRWSEWFYGVVKEYVAQYPENEGMAESIIENKNFAARLVCIEDTYYNGDFYDSGHFESGNKSAPVILTSIAFVIVLIAFINFVNFFFALVPVRVRSVNICKVFGASQKTLRWNFLFESIGLVTISLLLAFLLAASLQDSFITNFITCSLAMKDNIAVIIMIIILMLLMAVLAAFYPAFYITRFNASLGVKSGFAYSSSGRRLRSLMIGVQFTAAMILMIVSSVFFLQYRYMMKYDLGFDREHIVTVSSWDLRDRYETFMDLLQQYPGVEDATASYTNMFHIGQTLNRTYENMDYSVVANAVRWNFLDFFGFEIIEGEGFTPSSGERGEIVMMNRLHQEVGVPVGYSYKPENLTYIGVMKDVRLTSLKHTDRHFIFYCSDDEGLPNLYFRLRAGTDVKDFIKYAHEVSKEMSPTARVPHCYFLEQWVENMYYSTKQLMILIGVFALIAIVISLMGIFGIVLFETQHRRREIGIRKVYGATTENLIIMLVRRYAVIVVICFVVAAPVAYYITSRWLEQFANRITMPLWIYPVVLLLIMTITVLIVTLRSWKAANENPVEVVN